MTMYVNKLADCWNTNILEILNGWEPQIGFARIDTNVKDFQFEEDCVQMPSSTYTAVETVIKYLPLALH